MRPARDETIEALFDPVSVRAFACAAESGFVDELHDDERAAIEPMGQSRRAEYATARACARSALADLGMQGAVPRGDTGAPVWPPGVSGSISHTRGFCVAVATVDGQAIGVDVEEVARLKPAVERRILVDAERADLDALDAHDRRLRVAMIFAAKEAFYKAHYSIEPRYLGFDAVTVEVSGDVVRFGPASGEVEPELLARTVSRARLLHGRVLVGVCIRSADETGPLPSPA